MGYFETHKSSCERCGKADSRASFHMLKAGWLKLEVHAVDHMGYLQITTEVYCPDCKPVALQFLSDAKKGETDL